MTTLTTPYGLGRRPQFDERSRLFKVRELLDRALPLRSYTWSVPLTLDQGNEGACTGFAIAHEAAARPVKVRGITDTVARDVYHRARELDEWPGEDYEGSSVLAAVKAGKERGWYGEYRWAFDFMDVLLTLGYWGPVILGVNWYTGMFKPGYYDNIILPEGALRGGHAIVATGVSVRSKLVRLHNSWGPEWGNNGDCFIPWGPLQWLLDQDGEACVPVKRAMGT